VKENHVFAPFICKHLSDAPRAESRSRFAVPAKFASREGRACGEKRHLLRLADIYFLLIETTALARRRHLRFLEECGVFDIMEATAGYNRCRVSWDSGSDGRICFNLLRK
jgi:hypothetical protein